MVGTSEKAGLVGVNPGCMIVGLLKAGLGGSVGLPSASASAAGALRENNFLKCIPLQSETETN